MVDEEVRVLGVFVPSTFDPATIEAELRPRLPPCCRQYTISVRVPQGIAPQAGNLEWHQDDGGPTGTTAHMVVWASDAPTEIQRSDGSIVETVALQLLWFNNMRAFHRQPRGTDETRRWFVAVRCPGVHAAHA